MQIQPILGYFVLFLGYISHPAPLLDLGTPFLHIVDPPLPMAILREVFSDSVKQTSIFHIGFDINMIDTKIPAYRLIKMQTKLV